MNNKFKKELQVKKTPVQISDEIQIGLANNEEYDKMTDQLCVAIYNYFSLCNPDVLIEIPKKRIKSSKSIHEKSKSREIERLSKLCAIEEISNEEIDELYALIKCRIREKEQENEEEILKSIKDLLKKDIKKICIEGFLNTIMKEQISDNTKKALLRILRGKIERSNIENKKQILKLLDERCGKKAAEKFGRKEDDKIQYESVEAIKRNKDRRQLLYDRISYLKSEDLIGTRIVIADQNYNDVQMKTMAKKFIDKLIKDKSFLQQNNIEIIPFSLKHKNKTNGYEADHIKFRFIDKPEYTLELQIRSKYVENLSRANGTASNINRPGKERKMPNLDNIEAFIKKVKYEVPRYTLFIKENGTYKPNIKCNIRENVIAYYENELSIEDYEKIHDLLSSVEDNKTKK